MLISIKRAETIILVLTLTLTFLFLIDNNAINVGSFNNRIIVIDAGHGTPDGGAVSESGITENELNLKVAKYLWRNGSMLFTSSYLIRKVSVAYNYQET